MTSRNIATAAAEFSGSFCTTGKRGNSRILELASRPLLFVTFQMLVVPAVGRTAPECRVAQGGRTPACARWPRLCGSGSPPSHFSRRYLSQRTSMETGA